MLGCDGCGAISVIGDVLLCFCSDDVDAVAEVLVGFEVWSHRRLDDGAPSASTDR